MFTVGFKKIATFDHNNQGLEYNMSDNTNATSNVGPGGMSPQGMETYQPIPKQPAASPKERKRLMNSEKKAKNFDVVEFLMHKGASVRGNAGASDQKDVPGWTTNQQQSQKYDTSTPDASPEDMMNSIKDERARMKKFKKAEKK